MNTQLELDLKSGDASRSHTTAFGLSELGTTAAIVGLLACVGALGLTATAKAQTGTITSGTHTVNFQEDGGGGDGPLQVFLLNGVSQTYQIYFMVQIGAMTAELPLPAPDTADFTDDIAILTWVNLFGTGISGSARYRLFDTGPASAVLDAQLTLTNVLFGSVDARIIGYLDPDLGGTEGNDTAALSSGFVTITDDPPGATPPTRMQVGFVAGAPSDAYQVGMYPDFLRLLQDDTETQLDNTGLPFGPGDMVYAAQWNAPIPGTGGGGLGTLTRGFQFTALGPATGCGNGVVDAGENCDDGFADPCGTCNEDCSAAGAGSTCGDSALCPETEICDDGFADACGTCNADCTGVGLAPVCGDSNTCPESEFCDDGQADHCGSCNADCTANGDATSLCGDGLLCETDIVGGPAAEECDDENTDDGDGCSASCTVEMPDAGPVDAGSPDAGPVAETDAGPLDAGPPSTPDAGTARPDAGTPPTPDSGTAAIDAGGGGETDGGCSASAQKSGRSPAAPILLALGALGVFLRRRC